MIKIASVALVNKTFLHFFVNFWPKTLFTRKTISFCFEVQLGRCHPGNVSPRDFSPGRCLPGMSIWMPESWKRIRRCLPGRCLSGRHCPGRHLPSCTWKPKENDFSCKYSFWLEMPKSFVLVSKCNSCNSYHSTFVALIQNWKQGQDKPLYPT